MSVNEFAKLVASIEGKKVQVNIAQIAEVLKVANKLLGGKVYKEIKAL